MADEILTYGRTFFKCKGLLWIATFNQEGGYVDGMYGPYCPKCKTELWITEQYAMEATCPSCEIKYQLKTVQKDFQELVLKVYRSKKVEDWEIISLDLPPNMVKDEDNEDENYWIEARIGQKNGKKTAVVYVGEKIHGKQDKKDYVQLFLDVEDEQMRFDKGNKNPMKLLAKLTAEFPDSKTTTEIK